MKLGNLLKGRMLMSVGLWLVVMLWLVVSVEVKATPLADTIKQVKPAIVGIGTFQPTGRPQSQLRGTGFAAFDGLHIVTNLHVLPLELDGTVLETLVVFVGQGNRPERRQAEVVARDPVHDLAILKITGKALPALSLAPDPLVAEGELVAFTGFPIGAVLGLYPVTHRGIISSLTPIATPSPSAGQLDIASVRRLRDPYLVYQLDATAYPGNSGSPLYDTQTRGVIGILNMVFVKSTKEAVLSDPSGISYAIPVRHLRKLASSLAL